VVHDGAVVLIDPTTGRTLPGSVWTRGLHRMVCLKEGVEPPPATRTAIQITLQALFGRYCKLGGISGTLRESAWQLWWFYRVGVQRVEPRVPSRRREGKLVVYASREQQFEAIRARVSQHAAAGQAVLVGTDSVAAADALSEDMADAGIGHQLLTARDDRREAELIAAAGAPGAITVATNIAGRGTDILLEPRTLEAGGLHVVCCTQNASPRIDRQLVGRAARNGQPGSAETIVSLDDRAFADLLPETVLVMFRGLADKRGLIPQGMGIAMARVVQTLKVLRQFKHSWQLVRHDRLSRESLIPAAQAE
jgi:preprotein translocase subunit SecA